MAFLHLLFNTTEVSEDNPHVTHVWQAVLCMSTWKKVIYFTIKKISGFYDERDVKHVSSCLLTRSRYAVYHRDKIEHLSAIFFEDIQC